MKIRRKQRQSRAHALRWGVLITLVALCIAVYGGVQGVLHVIDEWNQDLPDVHDASHFSYSAKTRVYANDHETLLAEFYLQNQEPVEYDQVSPYVLEGTVATEDERFYDHNGVDLAGIARAVVNNMMGGALEGASTITQQLVRNTLLSDEATEISLERKVREAELAVQMEEIYSKEEILLMYLNTINYGEGCYGIEAAAQHYFQKSALDLTLVEAATLIGIPQSPTNNNPVKNPDACLKRRNLVLDRMLSNGIISQEEHSAAQAEELVLNVEEDAANEGIYLYPYFTSLVRDQLLDALSYEDVFEGGLTVYTTIDPTLQGYAEESAATLYDTLDRSGNTDVKVSLTCVDPHTGYVLAMIGGRDYSQSKWNLAANSSGRQAGSAFKTFTLAAAIEQGISPQTLIDCSGGFSYGNWTPENYGGASYGIRTLESATWVSSNTGYARLVTEENGVDPTSIVEMAGRLGVSGSADNGYGAYPAITLGVAQTTTLNMASAYGAFANEGMYYEDVCIEQVIDKNGEVRIDNTNPVGVQAVSPEVAYATTRVLQGVVTNGTGTEARLANQVSAGKTGTSQLWRDLWYCGYTPQLSCAVWTGADPEREMRDAPWCKTLWRDFMTRALADMPAEDFATAPEPTYDSPYTTTSNAKLAPREEKPADEDPEETTDEEGADGKDDEGDKNNASKPNEDGEKPSGGNGDKPSGGEKDPEKPSSGEKPSAKPDNETP